MKKCICGWMEEDENYMAQHKVSCFWAIREERDQLKERVRKLEERMRLHKDSKDEG